ncbi:MAG TPA: bifunctional glutamine-synthetase adenylyltransferase/deadenyltransferase, partial [Streptosporangiaceae bacterium]|nr:bifunctional glutamine-synthetase adenylyltransferase/deadenyltransferase [Streptosporangiaceae bacterium]
MGFADAARAERLLCELALTPDDELVVAVAAAADPDLALGGLARLLTAELRAALHADAEFRERLIAVLGVSAGLADHLNRHPADWRILQDPAAPVLDIRAETVPELAAAYRRQLLHLAARDLTGVVTVDEVSRELADIGGAVLESALAIARAEIPMAAGTRLAVIAMGKCGARELNYASDVDVIFVADPADPAAERLAAGLIGVCARSTPEGSIFPVDPNLRPEGRSGPLVRTLASHQAYYERWAKTWEFQALLKARPVAGDAELGAAYMAALGPLVWQASHRDRFVEDVQAMRRRVEESLPPKQAGRELKLGPGGLRDIEFAVQLLQLVHGRTDESLRVPGTLAALRALAAGGYVGRADADDLAESYRFLRRLGRAFNQNGLWFPSEATPA